MLDLFGSEGPRFKVLPPASFSNPAVGMTAPSIAEPVPNATLFDVGALPTNVIVAAEFGVTKKPAPGGIDRLGLQAPPDFFEEVKAKPFHVLADDLFGIAPLSMLVMSFVPLSNGLASRADVPAVSGTEI